MIIARVMGGLGNQLFIYAAARALAIRTGRVLKLDLINGYANDTFGRSYLLHHFPICATPATDHEVAAYQLHSSSLQRLRKLNRYLPKSWRNYYEERSLYDPSLIELVPRRTCFYMEGYWQREEYFVTAAEQIRAELTPGPELPGSVLQVAKRIKETSSVAIHLRRRDYAHVLEESYYVNALPHILAKVANPVFFVFSDDPEWAKKHLQLKSEVIHVDDELPNLDPFEAFQLMSLCRHHLIANSTFSWWAAWLGKHPGQQVVAPKNWGYRAAPSSKWLAISN